MRLVGQIQHVGAFAPGLEVLVDVARHADDSALGGDGQRMSPQIAGGAERSCRGQPGFVGEVGTIGDREQLREVRMAPRTG